MLEIASQVLVVGFLLVFGAFPILFFFLIILSCFLGCPAPWDDSEED